MPKRCKTKSKERKRKRLIAWDDKRAQKIMAYLWGTWWTGSLEKRIAKYFHCKGHPALSEVAQRIADIHFSGEGYSPEDITDELEKILP